MTSSFTKLSRLAQNLNDSGDVEGAAEVYVYNGTDYLLTGGRIFIGDTDPETEGFTLVDGDQWEDTSV